MSHAPIVTLQHMMKVLDAAPGVGVLSGYPSPLGGVPLQVNHGTERGRHGESGKHTPTTQDR